MIDLYTWTTPNGYKASIALEELGLDYSVQPIDITAGRQKTPEYLAINPNGRTPALVDGDLTLFESLAINLYLARRYDGGLWPSALEDEARVRLRSHVGGVGAPRKIVLVGA